MHLSGQRSVRERRLPAQNTISWVTGYDARPAIVTTTRDPTPKERLHVVTMRDGTNWLGRSFPTREEAITEAGKIGYGGPFFISEVVAVVE